MSTEKLQYHHEILEIDNLVMTFGGLRAIDGVSMHIDEGEIAALIGPNGAGKTTIFNCITGVHKPTEGKVKIRNRDGRAEEIQGLKPNLINRKGLARTFQNIRLFNNMTVLENVMIGRHNSLKAGVFAAIIRNAPTKEEEQRVIEESYTILKKLKLDAYVNEMAKNLPYGEQRRLEIARALATDPFLLLLDEPVAGMNAQETKELEETINIIRDQEHITILLIEHDMSLVMDVSERIYVLDYGKLIAEGSPHEIKKNPDVIKAYLGE
ncbi:MAG TPA: ABC transporter ATP-binding protein [Rectinema sp.]|jgi:branched-chain amino acid transport system ATP-binding protein|nr:ABC transporter ATP-binding protein [Rectinema sp.]HOM92761.1 ABC transporter ATP-binding protein [Rectinema sp.]HOR48651.1 ABC transporter ATP-binding protein [Rectinema sp.]HOU06988.1 ABC transporter ATP-binding protein [Rectinema sp.]HOW12236.1 ABC transporter ATP-binding protein [Rectinema sp.]